MTPRSWQYATALKSCQAVRNASVHVCVCVSVCVCVCVYVCVCVCA